MIFDEIPTIRASTCIRLSRKAEPRRLPAAAGTGRLPGSSSRSWIEVALAAEHRGPDVLIVDEVDSRPRAVGRVDRRTLVGGVQVRIQHLDADIELRHRIPLGACADLEEAEVGI